MVKNVIVVADYGYVEGGAARVAHDTAFALHASGFCVTFFCAVGPVGEELASSGVKVVCLNQDDILHEKSRLKGVLRGLNNKAAKREFDSLLKDFDPADTVIHVHTWTKALSGSVFKVAKKRGFEVLITVHDYFLVCPNGGLFNYKKREICNLKPMSAKCIACNCDARSYPQKLYRVLRQRRQNAVVRRCINISYAFISEFSKREFLKRYDKIPKERRYFLCNPVRFAADRFRVECEKNDTYLFIGGVTEAKGIRIFAEAVTKTGVPAVVIGQGILKEELEKDYPQINFVGWKSSAEMLPYIRKARCLVFPSVWYETMGLTPLEVMSYGVPVLCSKLNAASEYVDKDMQYDGTAQDLIKLIKKTKDNFFIEDVSRKIFSSFDTEAFSAENYLENLKKIYNVLLGKK